MDHMIPTRKIPVAAPSLNGNEQKYIQDCLKSGWISSHGEYVDRFEAAFADYCGTKHAIAVCNGTAALHLTLLAHDVGPGDEVLVPTLTYVATANAVRYCGATPVLVDCDPVVWNIDPDLLESKHSSRTKGIIVVPLYGHPVDMDRIMEFAQRRNLWVVEDAAEACGSTYKGRKCGSIAPLSTFSFFGNKVITTGEGGMVVAQDDELAKKIRILKGQGMDPQHRYWFPIVGYNYRMTNVQAAIGLAQLERIEDFLKRRKEIAERYRLSLRPLEDHVASQGLMPWATHSYWMYSIVLKEGRQRARDALAQKLAGDGIETRPIFYPMHTMPPHLDPNGSYAVADRISSQGLNLPTFYDLSNAEIDFICDRIRYHLFALFA